MCCLTVLGAAIAGFALIAAFPLYGGAGAADDGPCPTCRRSCRRHLQLVNAQQREHPALLQRHRQHRRGPLGYARPSRPSQRRRPLTTAVQEIRDSGASYRCGEQPKQVTACYNVVSEHVAGTFVFHPAHNHWHIGDVALFEIRKGSPTGPIVGGIRSRPPSA